MAGRLARADPALPPDSPAAKAVLRTAGCLRAGRGRRPDPYRRLSVHAPCLRLTPAQTLRPDPHRRLPARS